MEKLGEISIDETFKEGNKNNLFSKSLFKTNLKFNRNNNKCKKFIIILLLLFTIVIIIIIIIFIWNSIKLFIKNKKSLLIKCQKDSYLVKYVKFNLDEVNNFEKICYNGTLISQIPKSIGNPKISALIPVYNAGKYIKFSIRSIQNQNMSEIEIIVVDDCSSDNSLDILYSLQKEDQRIKIIKNKQNRGTLYTRSIGALASKGKFIMSLDNDDLFLNDIFNTCYNEAELKNLDIIEFAGCKSVINSLFKKNYCKLSDYLKHKENGVIIRQPELSNFIYKKIKKKYCLIDAYIWGKIIKTDVYKQALKTIGEEIYSQKICATEDRIVDFALFRVANSFEYIEKFGIVHNNNPKSVGAIWKKKNTFDEELLNIVSMYNLTKNSIDVFYPAITFHFLFDSSYITYKNMPLLKKLYKQFMLNEYLHDDIKELIFDSVGDYLNSR